MDGSLYQERSLATPADLDATLERARVAQRSWASQPLTNRCAMVRRLAEHILERREVVAEELTWQMGRPIRHAPLELGGFEERAVRMLELAPQALSPLEPPPKDGFTRLIRREPLGVVLVLAPWNYPWLTSVNAIVPALVAGNTVVLKHSEQTPLVPERWEQAAEAAGFPVGVLQFLHMSHDRTAEAVQDDRVDYVAFTGSVEGGRAVHRAAAERFIAVGLELGGKDPAYVRADADVATSAAGVADGAYFNAGQSCCGIERVYVHADVYDAFVDAFVAEAEALRLGDPTDPETTLGPLVRVSSAAHVRAQVDAALGAGARALIDESTYEARSRGDQYMPPQVLVDVTHDMEIMREETFGPVVGIMRVASDEQALELMNDSRYGLTASIWTVDVDRAAELGSRINTGTVFMNRCDYLDPDLAWVGVKDSGRGCTLSVVGYEQLTRPKSFHLRHRA